MEENRRRTPKEVGERIKYFRKRGNMTIKELAEALNMAESTIKKYENGERTPPLEVRQRMSERFRLSSVMELIEW